MNCFDLTRFKFLNEESIRKRFKTLDEVLNKKKAILEMEFRRLFETIDLFPVWPYKLIIYARVLRLWKDKLNIPN